MISKATARFWKTYAALPADIRKKAKLAYSMFREDPWHPSLHFKRVHSTQPVYSVRISKDYRAVGVMDADKLVWFWIGSHSDYDKMLTRKR